MKKYAIEVSYGMSAKMEGIPAISTDMQSIATCQARSKNENMICSKCYANANIKQYPSLKARLLRNTEAVKTLLPEEDLPIIKSPRKGPYTLVRFEAHGELFCWEQVADYFGICRKNPNHQFGMWTKNPGYIAKAIRMGYAKPDNLQIVLSSPWVNRPLNLDAIQKAMPFVDRTFTVYSKEYCQEHGLDESNFINCGSRDCLKCGQCYRKNGAKEIRELLKSR